MPGAVRKHGWNHLRVEASRGTRLESNRTLRSGDQHELCGRQLVAVFYEDLPRRPGISVLTSIALNYPTAPDAVAAVINQAGSPTVTDGKKPWVVAMWCFGFACHDMNEVLRDPKRGPTLLVHQGAGFTLEDGGAQARYESVLNAALAKHGITINNN